MNTLITNISTLSGGVYYINVPDVLDFSDPSKNAAFYISDGNIRLNLSLNIPESELRELLGYLKAVVFTPKSIIISWNIKNLISYCTALAGHHFRFESKLYELRVLEAFEGWYLDAPQDLAEARERLSKVLKTNWEATKKIYGSIHLPLIQEVLPAIESNGLIDLMERRRVFCHYVPEGQIYGRMKCLRAFKHCFNPHSLSLEERGNLRAPFYDGRFLYFDFCNMEVTVFAWLSDDPQLGEIVKAGDVYAGIWKRITGIAANAEQVLLCKRIFLPIVFGLSPPSLAETHEISLGAAKKMVENVHKEFSTGMHWVEQFQESVIATDYFGRIRQFPENQYKARSFVIQSPASIVCLDKLIKLHNVIHGIGQLAWHVHDGYVILTNKLSVDRIRKLATECLEAEETLYPGLKLKVKSEEL